ncbi:transglutaminase-like cysteine peptidase [Devosia sp.]|uniref:transglutaminase-like cysteine peptidase n=1 Tax=Devosia sp. TaxID=1871048 RepID=UPI003BAC3E54
MSTIKTFITAAIAIGMAAFIIAMPARADTTLVDFANPAFAPVGKTTSIPIGAAEFCKTHKADCAKNLKPVEAMALSDARWNQLVDTNNLINTAVVPETDQDLYHVAEFWAYPDGAGDCEDFALAKRKALIGAGWNPSTLMIAVVRERNGNGHAVLMVRTDRGDLVLDNQDGRVLLWNETPYQFLKRQTQASAGQWVDILDNRPTAVVASK